jgi:CPA2 family monovalent cation:H+ antiporter-2
VEGDQVRVLLAAGVISMTVTPLVIAVAPHISAGHRLLGPLERLLGARSIDEADEGVEALRGHVILAGYGPVGLQLTRVLEELSVRHVVLELNAETVREARKRGAPVYYADATSGEALQHAQLSHAAALVLLINDPRATRLALAAAQRVAPDVPVLVRTRYAGDRAALIADGAAEVVSEELQGGFEVLARVLRKVGVPRNVAEAHVASARVTASEPTRETRLARQRVEHVPELARLSFDTFLVIETSFAAGKTLQQVQLRQRTGTTLVALRRGDELRDEVTADHEITVGDMLFLVGSEDALCRASYLLQGGEVQQVCPV